MGLHIIAEALARIEHKVDAICRWMGVAVYPMHFYANTCPGCNKTIEYVVDVQHQVVVRRCDCKTGKIATTIPLTPIGAPSDKPSSDSDRPAEWPTDGSRTEDRNQRKAR